MTAPVLIAEDRSLLVGPGQVVRTREIDVFKVRLANRTPMGAGDIDRAMHRRLQTGAAHPYPCPTGQWDGDEFVIFDGRHQWLATVALGHGTILVAWVEAAR